MITIKMRYKSPDEFQEILLKMRQQQNSVIRSSFNRLQEGKTEKYIRQYIKTLKNVNCLDSWWISSGIFESSTIYRCSKSSKLIFGGKYNFRKFLKKQITKEEYKTNRLLPLVSIGEALQNGNRKFTLDISNNRLIYKDNRGRIKYDLVFKEQLRDRLEQLLHIEDATREKKQPLMVRVDEEFIYLIFKPKQKEVTKKITNRVFSIDTNPNNIGWSVCDINDSIKVIDSGIIELKELNKQSKNKKHHETYEICKFLVNKAEHYKCEQFAVENLSIKSNNFHKGKKFNKLVNNDWLRSKLFSNLEKRCFISNIRFTEVNPAYTSIIGGTIHREYPDPIAPTLEIARRAIFKYQKGQFYPELPSVDVLNEQWKQTLERSFVSWREIADWLKNTEYRYRVSIDSFKSMVFRLKSKRNTVSCRSFMF